MDQTKLIERITKSGANIGIVGLIMFVAGVIFFFVLKSVPELSTTFIINALLGLFLIFIGRSIKNNYISAKGKLIFVLILSIVLIIVNLVFSSGNVVLYLPILLLVSSIMGLDGTRKLNNPAALQKEIANQNLKGASKLVDILKMVGIAIIVIGVFILLSYFWLR